MILVAMALQIHLQPIPAVAGAVDPGEDSRSAAGQHEGAVLHQGHAGLYGMGVLYGDWRRPGVAVVITDRLAVADARVQKDRSANGTSASIGRAERIMRSNSRGWSGSMRSSRGGAEELPTHAQGRIFRVVA